MKKTVKIIIVVLILILGAATIYLNSLLDIITGYAAKNLASGVFVSGRTQEDMESTDLNFSFIAFTKNKVNIQDMSVSSRFLWGKSTAIYRDKFGVTLLRDISDSDLRNVSYPGIPEPGYDGDTLDWPKGDIINAADSDIDHEALNMISDSLIEYDSYGGSAYAFMVLHRGEPVAEAYKKRFNSKTRFLSWSMAKSVVNAMIGIMTKEGLVDINSAAGIEAWEKDKRSEITLNNLMQMQSGLHWNEDYGNRSDITVMLHEAYDFAEFAYSQELDYDPGSHWYYSSGTTNIVSYLLRQKFKSDDDYYAFPQRDLFYRIGITDAVFECDPSGTIVGSSYLYMTARDYARFALLYEQDGIFCGDTLFPRGWVDYTVAEAEASGGEYGSFFWLNRSGELPSAPRDMYMCVGHDGQRIFILPSRDLIIVVLGYSPDGSMDFDRLVKDILDTIPL
ncbi:MAG: serine hydrolase [Marinilabiliaceae bacterium]|jgi:CubicO group peptidase (beta-lactamase class C family)|nr:serine hydrolase [Marinilabiliaceae bacterium]